MELMGLVQAHSLLASKFLPRTVDLYHPNTNLFLNSNGKPIRSIQCKHFKKYIGLPITGSSFTLLSYHLKLITLFQPMTSEEVLLPIVWNIRTRQSEMQNHQC